LLENLYPNLSRRKGAVFLRKTFLVSLPCPFSGKRGEKVPKTALFLWDRLGHQFSSGKPSENHDCASHNNCWISRREIKP